MLGRAWTPFILAAVTGCGSAVPPVCTVDETLRERLADPTPTCGFVIAGSSAAAYAAAHDCAALAIQQEQPFVARWDSQLIDYGEGSYAFSGVAGPDGYVVTRFAGGTKSDFSTYSDVRTCSQLADLGACSDITSSLCLQCAGPTQQACP